jgi:hypothetical protein
VFTQLPAHAVVPEPHAPDEAPEPEDVPALLALDAFEPGDEDCAPPVEEVLRELLLLAPPAASVDEADGFSGEAVEQATPTATTAAKTNDGRRVSCVPMSFALGYLSLPTKRQGRTNDGRGRHTA